MNKEKNLDKMKEYLEELKLLAQADPEVAKRVSKESLIRAGVLNEDGTSKEHIVDYPSYIGNDVNPMSYEDIVDTMKMCADGIKELGKGDHKKTHDMAVQLLIDSGFVSKEGHVIVREKRSPEVEAFFKRVEEEYRISNKQRVRK